jgi:hypothetical protein
VPRARRTQVAVVEHIDTACVERPQSSPPNAAPEEPSPDRLRSCQQRCSESR